MGLPRSARNDAYCVIAGREIPRLRFGTGSAISYGFRASTKWNRESVLSLSIDAGGKGRDEPWHYISEAPVVLHTNTNYYGVRAARASSMA
jgi:hypothetical protein